MFDSVMFVILLSGALMIRIAYTKWKIMHILPIKKAEDNHDRLS